MFLETNGQPIRFLSKAEELSVRDRSCVDAVRVFVYFLALRNSR
jgi:hypothetical protein